jgi:hypothetical protein
VKSIKEELKMTLKKLVKAWNFPDRTQERQQFTLRLNYDIYAKLLALKEVYPTRSVNEIINDILSAGLDEIIEELPQYRIDVEEAIELAHYQGGKPDDYANVMTGPKVKFEGSYMRILNERKEESNVHELKSIEGSEGAS